MKCFFENKCIGREEMKFVRSITRQSLVLVHVHRRAHCKELEKFNLNVLKKQYKR